jgi:hypothetical protein
LKPEDLFCTDRRNESATKFTRTLGREDPAGRDRPEEFPEETDPEVIEIPELPSHFNPTL